ncbi:hypothetical protein N7516_003126 [Penicillium verrucosum]|uniref:uncharacterized protein n=1 Tax=Penicillium verrucosum TaxID=60171 RepID=UPI0025454D0A|nr:uncharacterized protein N7516_003126 [Penicillium verrucosum]KAJ5942958.1 hypothetical protein N7516_003126 [Penicillium verrucosum]
MHHLETFHGDPELVTRSSKEPCSIEKAVEFLKAWHEGEKPFFTKKDLQDVSNQLNRRYYTRRKSDSKQLISVKGLSGSKIYYQVITGQVLLGAENEEWEVQKPKLRYSCYEQLVSAVESRTIDLAEAFFPVQIEHFMLARASDTKQPTSRAYVENPVALDETLEATLKSWKKTPEFQELSSILQLVFNAHEVTKVVGIASGSMEFGPESQPETGVRNRKRSATTDPKGQGPCEGCGEILYDNIHRSAVQHSIMITIRDRIEEITNKKIQLYAQDPCYTAIDTWALAQHDCKVLEDPQALLEIDDNSVLFSCCPALPLKEITVDFARPVMLIWGRVVLGTIVGRHNPNTDRVRNMIEHEYDCYEFWGIYGAGHGPFVSNLVVYIRRE